MMRGIYILLIVFACIGNQSIAQLSYTYKAYKAYQSEELKFARAYSDTSITVQKELEDPQTWKIRGFVYYESFNKKEGSAEELDKFLDISEEAFKKVLEIDTSGLHVGKAKTALYNIAVKYNNRAGRSMNDKEYKNSIKSFKKFKELMAVAKPEVDLTQKDIEFNNALAFLLHNIYKNDKKKNEAMWQMSIDAYTKTLEIDSLNKEANYEIGILYYNKGVDVLLSIPTDASLDVIFETQDKTMALFLKSRPYMIIAYRLDPTNEQVLDGLEGIDYELNRPEEVELWRSKKKELKEGKK